MFVYSIYGNKKAMTFPGDRFESSIGISFTSVS